MPLYPFGEHTPQVAPDAFVAPGAHLIGQVRVESEASIWFNAVLRGDVDAIVIGARSNVQDGSVLHADSGLPLTVGRDVTVGHSVILHGCTIEDEALIGMGAIVLNGAVVERGALVAAGALVPERARIPAGHLAVGVPARVLRPLNDAERERMAHGLRVYIERARLYRERLGGV